MKGIKKAVLVLFSVFLAIFVGACSRNTPVSGDSTIQITVWHYYNGSQLDAFDRMVREFNSTVGWEAGIHVEAEGQGGISDLTEHIWDIVEGVAGEGGLPDIFGAYPDMVLELKEMGYTVNLEDYMEAEDIAGFVAGFWEEGCLPPDYVATIFPMAKATELLYIDSAAWSEFLLCLEEQGEVLPEDSLSTWEGIVEAADLYYQTMGKSMFGIDSTSNYIFTVMQQQGMDVEGCLRADGRIYWDEEAFRKMFDIYYTSVLRGGFGMSGRYRSDDTKTGEIISYLGSSTGAPYFPDKVTFSDGSQKQAELMALPIPIVRGGKRIVVQQGAGMVVTKSDEGREAAAIQFLKWLTEKEQNLQFSVDSSYLPVMTSALFGDEMEVLLGEMAESEDVSARNTAKVFATVLEQLQDYETYYTVPISGLYKLRQELESLDEYAREGRRQVLILMEDGIAWEEAVGQQDIERAYLEFKNNLVKNTILSLE